MPPFLFDFTLKKPNMTYVPEQGKSVARIKPDTGNSCPYPIPKLDDIFKLIERAYTVSKDKLISDTFECGAIAISNQVDFTQSDEREKRYLQIINHYKPDEQKLIQDIFTKVFALLSSVVYDNGVFADYLGELFMRSNVGNKTAGQFFTPFHISSFMAKCALDENQVKAIADKDEIITINDPCCGSGGMMLAAADVLQNDYQINYARNCFIECADIDIRCVHMAYLQLSLAGIPAVILHRDSLTMKTWSVWKTPAFIFQYHRFAKYDNYRRTA